MTINGFIYFSDLWYCKEMLLSVVVIRLDVTQQGIIRLCKVLACEAELLGMFSSQYCLFTAGNMVILSMQ